MVALALLCGCDYCAGACGSSITTAVGFLHTVADDEIIPRLLAWVTEPDRYAERARWVSVPGRCDRCGHGGRKHARDGCPVCATHRGCNDTGHKAKVAEVKRELSLRSRALSSGMLFPEPKVMKEFLNNNEEKIDIDSLTNPTPSLINFVKLMSNKLDWSARYCVSKFLPLLTKWHLQDRVPCRTIKPITIRKKRNPRGVPSYEVVWSDIDEEYEALISDDQFEADEDPSVAWTSTERQDLMRRYYPEVVEAFEESIKKPVKEKKTRGNKKKEGAVIDKPKRKYTKKVKAVDVDIANLSASMKNVDLSMKTSELNSSKLNVSVCVNKLKRKFKSKTKGQKTLDSFIANKRRKSMKKTVQILRRSFQNFTINYEDPMDPEDVNNRDLVNENKLALSMINTSENDINESELSDLVDGIVIRAPMTKTAKVDNRVLKLVFDKFSTPRKSIRKSVLTEIHNNCSTPRDSPIRGNSFNTSTVSNHFVSTKISTSYFFDKLTDDRDAFEISMEYKHKSAVITIDCDTTLDYSLPDVRL